MHDDKFLVPVCMREQFLVRKTDRILRTLFDDCFAEMFLYRFEFQKFEFPIMS